MVYSWLKVKSESEKCYTSTDICTNKIKEKILILSNEFLFF